ncbi:glycosyltransferase [Azotobacter chroococcum]|uniref:glycosyltransferase n=1 Tax=Azotobacter chroococcum TaxID=353 RepID=UPI0010ADDAF7|nr:glycosyltransferase [Azotobacter chroococcum]TKD44152.1 glycosyltransferase [Azotobacter chroococcum]
MRIVIDLQGAQAAAHKCEVDRHTLSLAKAIIQNRGEHEVILMLSGLFPDTIEPIRSRFDGVLSQKYIKVWHSIAPVCACDESNKVRREIAEHMREAFLASLNPDWVIVSGLMNGLDDEAVVTVGAFAQNLRTVALIDTLDSPVVFSESSRLVHTLRQLEQVKRAEYVFALPPLTVQQINEWLGMPIDQVHSLCREDASDINIDAKGLLSFLQDAHRTDVSVARLASRPRLAYVSPLPPEKSGIADYSAELLPELARYYDIDVVTDQVEISDPWIIANCTVCRVEDFIAHAQRYDRVLYHFGNSHYHAHMFGLIEHVPGVVLLHDFFLGDAQWYREIYGGSEHTWSRALYQSHGYKALQARYSGVEEGSLVRGYPVNFDVLKHALGIVAHSDYSRELAAEWYGQDIANEFSVIPLLRASPKLLDKAECRQALGLEEDDFVVCSFGFLGATKLNHRLLNAWLSSRLAADKRCILVFVGKNSSDEYGERLERTLNASGARKRIRITGWTDMSTYRSYLAAADVAIQLRTHSRGETSAAVLDCMNYGLPTIVNANGTMAELPSHAVYLLPDTFEDAHLVEAMELLWSDFEERGRLTRNSLDVIRLRHKPAFCAAELHSRIEGYYAGASPVVPSLINAIADLEGCETLGDQLIDIARMIDMTLPARRPGKTIFLDITATCHTDLKTGIERVARALTVALIKYPPVGYRVEPVYLGKSGSSWSYSYARRYAADLLGIPSNVLWDEVAQLVCGDIVLGLDISGEMLIHASKEGFFESLRADGVQVYFMVYDLLPLLLPHTFPPGADASHARWLSAVAEMDGAICITQSVADDLHAWCSQNIERQGRPFHVRVSHLGADIGSSVPSRGLPENAHVLLSACKVRPTFLMVGTIEPRKGYLFALEAFRQLWSAGVDVNLVIVGKEGWVGLPDEMRRTIPRTIELLRSHPESGKRLFWLEGISDEYLEQVYAAATCLIAASEGEGFGLPLIEAAQHKLPIIARDIPVFREVAGEHAYYFKGLTEEDLVTAIGGWLQLYKDELHPASGGMSWLTWEKCADQIKRALLESQCLAYDA